MAKARGFLLQRAAPTRAEAVVGLTVSPQAATVSPTAKMFWAALTSRSWVRPHPGHVHCLMSSIKESSTCPQAEQRLLLGYHRSILTVKGTPIRGGFVLQQAHELPPADIVNRFGQRRMFDHRLYPQTLHADRLVLTNDAGGELVQEVGAAVGNAGMDTSDGAVGLGAVPGTKLFLGQPPLGLRQLLLISGKEAGIVDLLTTIEDDDMVQSQINADLPGGNRQWRNLVFEAEN